jgi:alpha-beta hydrolase superfamily lysophospholipase
MGASGASVAFSLDGLPPSPTGRPRPLDLEPLNDIKEKALEERLFQYRVERTPNARLGYEVPIADKTQVLGSTQINGCHGDFCAFDMSYLEVADGDFTENDSGALRGQKSLSDFRSKMLARGASTEFIARDSTVSKLLNTEGGTLKKAKSNPQLVPLAGAGPVATQWVTHKSIIKARQEMPLVKMQLERHRKGEVAPYVREETYTDMEISGKLPAKYYEQVPVCMNCFKVYHIVDTARAKALTTIAEKHGKPIIDREPSDAEKAGVKIQTMKTDTGDSAGFMISGLTSHQVNTLTSLGGGRRRDLRTSPDNTLDSVGTVTNLSAIPAPTEAELEEERRSKETLQAALQAINGLTKMDVAEIRTMNNPHPAVCVVLEAVAILLTGKPMTFDDTRKQLLGNGELFLRYLKEFDVAEVTDERLQMLSAYVDHPAFRAEHVVPVSLCASKFCAWVHGVAHAARYRRGLTHKRIDIIRAVPAAQQQQQQVDATRLDRGYLKPLRKPAPTPAFNRGQFQTSVSSSVGGSQVLGTGEEVSYIQKIEKMKPGPKKTTNVISRQGGDVSGSAPHSAAAIAVITKPSLRAISRSAELDGKLSQSLQQGSLLSADSSLLSRNASRFDPGPSPAAGLGGTNSSFLSAPESAFQSSPTRKPTKRESKAMLAVQKKSIDRLAAQNVAEGANNILSTPKEFRCADGITKLPYMVLGQVSLNVSKCNFVVIHDFFDTCDATAIMMKPIVQRHEGCQVFCFNYPGQAHTVWPRLSAAEKERGAREPILNNDWIADRLNELLRNAEENGDMLLSNPFHLVGIGNGACIAAAFCQRWGRDNAYVQGLRSVVSLNGFLYPDPQLASILHSAYQVFESAPHSRPDIPVSFWSRFVFSDEYLLKINPNLALNIYTAVSNPITNDGRAKIAQGCLKHRDMRGALSPDFRPARLNPDSNMAYLPVQVPVVVLQSTENSLVNASNVDSFLQGRNCKHLWSHMLNVPSDALVAQSVEFGANWVGKMSSGPEDYHKYSTLGKPGLKMLLESLRSPRGAFAMWTRSGHVVHQEYKAAVLDLFDVLACPTDAYVGMDLVEAQEAERQALLSAMHKAQLVEDSDEISKIPELAPPKVDVLFKLETTASKAEEAVQPPKRARLPSSDGQDITSLLDSAAALERPVVVAAEDDEGDFQDGLSLEESVQDLIKDIKYTKPFAEEEVRRVEDDADLEYTEPAPAELAERETEELSLQASQLSGRASMDYSYGELLTPDASMSLASMPRLPEAATAHPRPHTLSQSPSLVPSLRPKSLEEPLSPRSSSLQLVRMEQDSPTKFNAAPHTPTVLNDLYSMDRPNLPMFSPQPSLKSEEPIVDYTPLSTDIVPTDHTGAKVVRSIKDGVDRNYLAGDKQKVAHEWASVVPDAATALELEAELRQKQQEYLDLENRLRDMRMQEEVARLGRIDEAQAGRREEYDRQDKALLAKLQADLDARQRERDFAERQRRVEMAAIEKALVEQGLIPAVSAPSATTAASAGHAGALVPAPVPEIAPMRYEAPPDLPRVLQEGMDVISKLDRMKEDEIQARKRGTLTVDEYEKVKREMAERQMQRDNMLRQLSKEEKDDLFDACAIKMQMVGRGYLGRKRFRDTLQKRKEALLRVRKAIKIQSIARAHLGRKRFNRIRDLYLNNIKNAYSASQIQRVYRGHADRKYFRKLRRWVCAIKVERVFRGHLGRLAFAREKARLEGLRTKEMAAAKLQSVWRMKVAKEEFRSLRIHVLAAVEIQRMYRGFLGRKHMKRRRLWESTTPGPDRIKLGLEFIEESKQAFERQQEEIDALHRAQERAEARVSHIHAELSESEKELVILERELQEIDQIERDLSVLTHERDLLTQGIEDAAGMPRLAGKGHKDLVMGKESNNANDPIHERRRKAEAYALEMTIQIKRAEREKKRQELEIEFAQVFQEVEKKKKALERLELSLNDMETTRERKDREFKRLQRNLMQLLMEQKQELDDLREKGIELETATATTAAAAVATAQKAREHEQRSTAMFSQTEELMKFQFMSMSLSYFSSLNMLKSLRDMNADTTSAAITMSADASATAAAAAAAANLPNMKKLNLGASDFVEGHIHRKKAELEVRIPHSCFVVSWAPVCTVVLLGDCVSPGRLHCLHINACLYCVHSYPRSPRRSTTKPRTIPFRTTCAPGPCRTSRGG